MNRRRIFGILKLSVGILLLSLLISKTNVNKLLFHFNEINYTWLLISISAIFISSLVGALNFFILVRQYKINFFNFIPIYWFSWGASLITPGQVGDVFTLGYWLKSKDVKLYIVTSCIIADKLTSLFWLILLAIYGFYSILNVPIRISLDSDIILAALIPFGLCGAGLVLLIYYKIDFLINLLNWFKANYLNVLLNLNITVIKIVITGIAYQCTFKALGAPLNFTLLLPLIACSSLIAYIPISFNGLGIVESAAGFLFALVGVPLETTLLVYLLMRLNVILAAWIPIIFFSGKKT